MTYNFDNIAIRCDTWQQMERLAEIAEKQGIESIALNQEQFNIGYVYFIVVPDFNGYTNVDMTISTETVIPFTTFITSHPDYSVEGC